MAGRSLQSTLEHIADLTLVFEEKRDTFLQTFSVLDEDEHNSSALFFDRAVRVRAPYNNEGKFPATGRKCRVALLTTLLVSLLQLLQRREPEPPLVAGLLHLLTTGFSRLARAYADVRFFSWEWQLQL